MQYNRNYELSILCETTCAKNQSTENASRVEFYPLTRQP